MPFSRRPFEPSLVEDQLSVGTPSFLSFPPTAKTVSDSSDKILVHFDWLVWKTYPLPPFLNFLVGYRVIYQLRVAVPLERCHEIVGKFLFPGLISVEEIREVEDRNSRYHHRSVTSVVYQGRKYYCVESRMLWTLEAREK